jgi:hypothetical protein
LLNGPAYFEPTQPIVVEVGVTVLGIDVTVVVCVTKVGVTVVAETTVVVAVAGVVDGTVFD